jgi:integrative and conjugative element protein (TIGR02256 family)
VGRYKAEGLAAYITSMYRLDTSNVRIRPLPVSVFELLGRPDALSEASCLIDASASSAVLNALVSEQNVPTGVRYSRCEIAHEGILGLLLWEGSARNPRLDDVQAFLFDLGRTGGAVSRWLQEHRRAQEGDRHAALEEIGIGLSCSSSTLRLADYVVSFHAAAFASAFVQREHWLEEDRGAILLSHFFEPGRGDAPVEMFHVPPVLVLEARNNPGWQIRIHAKARRKARRWTRLAGRNETGGIILGLIHRRRKVIHVTDLLPPSPDSDGSPYAFRRGVEDYPSALRRIGATTGNLIRYVGEWHSHPRGAAEPSKKDRIAAEQIRRHLQAAGIPTHLMIFGRAETASFVFTG